MTESPPKRQNRYWHDYIADGGSWRKKNGLPPGEDLAAMRAGLGREAGTVPALWPYYRAPVNDWLARRGELSAEQHAEHAALALFGLHQQSKDQPMHRDGRSLGAAIRALRDHEVQRALAQRRSADDGARPVDRLMDTVATATSLPVLLRHLRSTVPRLREISQPLDYDRLARDLHDYQYPDRRTAVRRRWGLDYYGWSLSDPSRPSPIEPSDPGATP